jgi:hypothetical protein
LTRMLMELQALMASLSCSTKIFEGVIKDDLLALFNRLDSGDLNLARLNYGTVILIRRSISNGRFV